MTELTPLASVASTDHGGEFTLTRLISLMAQFPKADRVLVGIVTRPEYAEKVRGLARICRTPGTVSLGFPDLPVHTDHRQAEPYLAFYDLRLMRAYLARHEIAQAFDFE